MAEYKTEIRPKADDGTYSDIIYPKTTADMVQDEINGGNVQDHLNDNAIHVRPSDRDRWNSKIDLTEKGTPNGVATLDASGAIPASQLGSLGNMPDIYVTDNNFNRLKVVIDGEEKSIYYTEQYLYNAGYEPVRFYFRDMYNGNVIDSYRRNDRLEFSADISDTSFLGGFGTTSPVDVTNFKLIHLRGRVNVHDDSNRGRIGIGLSETRTPSERNVTDTLNEFETHVSYGPGNITNGFTDFRLVLDVSGIVGSYYNIITFYQSYSNGSAYMDAYIDSVEYIL